MKKIATLLLILFSFQNNFAQVIDGMNVIPLNLQVYETKGNHPGIDSSFYVTSTTIRPQLQFYKFIHPRIEIYTGFGTFKFKDKVKIGGSVQTFSNKFGMNWTIPEADRDLIIAAPTTREKYFTIPIGLRYYFLNKEYVLLSVSGKFGFSYQRSRTSGTAVYRTVYDTFFKVVDIKRTEYVSNTIYEADAENFINSVDVDNKWFYDYQFQLGYMIPLGKRFSFGHEIGFVNFITPHQPNFLGTRRGFTTQMRLVYNFKPRWNKSIFSLITETL